MRQKRGFTILYALLILVSVSSLLALLVTSSNQNIAKVQNDYIKKQMRLLARSAVEMTLLKLSSTDINPSSHDIYFGSKYHANVQLDYIDNIETLESNGTVIVDVFILYLDNDVQLMPLRYHRRVIQKP